MNSNDNISEFENILFSLVQELMLLKPHYIAGLQRLGIIIIRDLLFYRPNYYIQKKLFPDLNIVQDQEHVIIRVRNFTKNHTINNVTTYYGKNDTGTVKLIFFRKPSDFIANRLLREQNIIIEGKILRSNDNVLSIYHPEIIFNSKNICILQPVYPLTYGITNKQIHTYILKALKIVSDYPYAKLRMVEFFENLNKIHLPSTLSEAWSSIKRLSFTELISHQYGLSLLKQRRKLQRDQVFTKAELLQKQVLDNLGFTMTESQQQVIHEIEQDQLSDKYILRILQGDVGSGKTLVALLTILNVVKSKKYQAALMVPTDLLANQHAEFFLRVLKGTGLIVELLTGKTRNKHRKNIIQRLEQGKIDILIGTHALFQKKVKFYNLAYIVIDEQHRFGVKQRLELINKSSRVDLLMMTATPIPRSLTISMFGEIEISKMLQKPKNRAKINTIIMSKSKIGSLISSIQKKIENNEKVFWICATIEPGEEDNSSKKNLADIETRFQILKKEYHDKVLSAHSKMSSDIKNKIMLEFKSRDSGVLVSTTIIEVGIDIPDATLIIIENAENFGLAQLHQLRGRVGRGSKPSCCVLLYEPQNLTIEAKKRLEILRDSDDGFYIAEKDLELRGGGEIFGTKQSGEQGFYFVNLYEDHRLLNAANNHIIKSLTHADYTIELIFLIKLFNRYSTELVKV